MANEVNNMIANNVSSNAMKHRDFVTNNNRKKIVYNTDKV